MYKVSFKYSDGRKGVCIEDGKTLLFKTEAEATEFADNLNQQISEEMKDFFPVWYVEKI